MDLSDKHHNEICSCVPCWPSKIPRGHSIPIRLGTCWTNSKSLSKRSSKTASHSGDCLGNIEIRKCSCPCVTSLRTYLYNSRWLPCSKGYSRLCYAQSPSIWIPNAGKTRPCLTHTYHHIDANGNLIMNQGNFYPFRAGCRACAGESLENLSSSCFLLGCCGASHFFPRIVILLSQGQV